MLHLHELSRASHEANGHGPCGIIPIHFTVSLSCSLVMHVSTISHLYKAVVRIYWPSTT